MFDSLDEQMEKDEQAETTNKERLVHYALIALVSVLVFGGLFVGLHWLE
jgi:hypothetical protein